MKIKENLFDLTPEQEALSKSMYGGKILKCLIAPHHTYHELEKGLIYHPGTYLFPEREMTTDQSLRFISLVVSSTIPDEIYIITKDLNVILDMVDGCVRILHENGSIHDCPEKTFAANQHTIIYNILKSERYKNSPRIESSGTEMIQGWIKYIQTRNLKITQAQYEEMENKISLIGEEIMRRLLFNQLRSIEII